MEYIKKFEELELNPMKWEPIQELVLKNAVKKLKFPNVSNIKFSKVNNYLRYQQKQVFQILLELKDSFTNLKNLGLDIKGVNLRLLIGDTLSWELIVLLPKGEHHKLSIDSRYQSGHGCLWGIVDDINSIIISHRNSIGKFKIHELQTIIDGILRDLPLSLNELRTSIPIWIKRRNELNSDYEKKRQLEIDKHTKLKNELGAISDLFYELEEISTGFETRFTNNFLELDYKIKGLKVKSQRKSRSVSYRATVELDFNEAHLEITDELLKVFKVISTAKKRVESMIPGCKLSVYFGDGWVRIKIGYGSTEKYNETGEF